MVTLNEAEAARILGPRYATLVADVAPPTPHKRGPNEPVESEKVFMGKVMRLLRECNWLTYHTYRSVKSAPGFPDLVCVRAGRVLFIELKTVDGDVSAFQDQWITALKGCAGVETYLWTPGDWAEIARVVV